MAFFGVRLPDDLASRFDKLAGVRGRSEALRELVDRACAELGDLAALPVDTDPPDRIEIRLRKKDAEAIELAASEKRMKRTEWIVSLIQTKLHGAALPPPNYHSKLVDIRRELRLIGRNVNQAVKALHAANMEDSRLELSREADRVATMKEAIDEQMKSVTDALQGERAYWETADE